MRRTEIPVYARTELNKKATNVLAKVTPNKVGSIVVRTRYGKTGSVPFIVVLALISHVSFP